MNDFRNRASQWVDISRLTSDATSYIIDLTEKHNALNLDVDNISGVTLEEKMESWEAFRMGRLIIHWFHKKRFHIVFFTTQLWLTLNILEHFGIKTEGFAFFMQKIIQEMLPGN